MGIEDHIGRGVIRISLSYSQGSREYSSIAEALTGAYTKLGKIKSY
jgi:cysteine sulfinate desulfinase/cysteine desulfurase-like protein